MTQRQLAEVTAVSPSTLSRYFAGKRLTEPDVVALPTVGRTEALREWKRRLEYHQALAACLARSIGCPTESTHGHLLLVVQRLSLLLADRFTDVV
ncbi:helix-turn-helix domain-containing protein [Streptomyces fagopyri]